jgi:hypothetical protein
VRFVVFPARVFHVKICVLYSSFDLLLLRYFITGVVAVMVAGIPRGPTKPLSQSRPLLVCLFFLFFCCFFLSLFHLPNPHFLTLLSAPTPAAETPAVAGWGRWEMRQVPASGCKRERTFRGAVLPSPLFSVCGGPRFQQGSKQGTRALPRLAAGPLIPAYVSDQIIHQIKICATRLTGRRGGQAVPPPPASSAMAAAPLHSTSGRTKLL